MKGSASKENVTAELEEGKGRLWPKVKRATAFPPSRSRCSPKQQRSNSGRTELSRKKDEKETQKKNNNKAK